MNGTQASSWLLLAAPFGFVVYMALLLGFLWLAVRVVRHAWYWQSASQRALRDQHTSSQPKG